MRTHVNGASPVFDAYAVFVTAAMLATCSACSGHAAAPPIWTTTMATPAPGAVAIPVDSPMLNQIHVSRVEMMELPTDEVVAPGKIEANPNRIAKIVLPVAGRIATVSVKTGDAVHRDQPLLTIESPDADAAMSTYLSAEASLTQARAALVKGQADADRAADLFEHNAIANKEVLNAESALAQAKAALEQAQASRDQAVRRLGLLGLLPGDVRPQVVVRAPLAGKVLDLSVVPGEYRNDTNAALMTIADLSTVWVTSQVAESYIRFVQLGERVEISLVAYPGETFEGRVSRIADTVDPPTRTVKVQAEMDNRDGRLRPEMYGSIHHIESTAKMTVLPIGAIVQANSRSVVYVQTAPGRFQQREVTLGKRAGDVVRVLNGVRAGDAVVADGAMLLDALVRRS